MTARTDVINIHSSIENNAPIITLKIDPVMGKGRMDSRLPVSERRLTRC